MHARIVKPFNQHCSFNSCQFLEENTYLRELGVDLVSNLRCLQLSTVNDGDLHTPPPVGRTSNCRNHLEFGHFRLNAVRKDLDPV